MKKMMNNKLFTIIKYFISVIVVTIVVFFIIIINDRSCLIADGVSRFYHPIIPSLVVMGLIGLYLVILTFLNVYNKKSLYWQISFIIFALAYLSLIFSLYFPPFVEISNDWMIASFKFPFIEYSSEIQRTYYYGGDLILISNWGGSGLQGILSIQILHGLFGYNIVRFFKYNKKDAE